MSSECKYKMPWKRSKPSLSTKQLFDVFGICDPCNTGRVKIEYLQELVASYAGEQAQEINSAFRRVDRHGQGSLTFRQFSAGIRLIMRQKENQERHKYKDSMLSPMTSTAVLNNTSPTTPSPLVTSSHGGGGGIRHHPATGGPEPTFILSPPDSPRATNGHHHHHHNHHRHMNGGVATAASSGASSAGDATATVTATNKSQCSSLSDGDNYECYHGATDGDADSGISGDRPPSDGIGSPLNNPSINRHTWLRTSLRRTSPSNQENLPNRRWGSFRHSGKRQQLSSNSVASHLYRSSSFNSSGRSSTCDTADDMYSDGSLEEDPVLDLNHKVQELQQQMGVFQDSANHNNERYTKAKADNAALQVRVMMLEEQLRESEMRYEERLQDEQKRSKEQISRMERERQLQLENSSIRLQAAETECTNCRDEMNRQRMRLEKVEQERKELSDQVQDLRNELLDYKEQEHIFKEQERRLTKEQEIQVQLIDELSHEVERLRAESRTPALPTTSPEALRLDELHEEMSLLRERNGALVEANEELQASILHAGVEQGRKLTAGEHSLAAELEAMTQDEPDNPKDGDSVAKMQLKYKELQDVNVELRNYIDGILLNIVDNYPQLLEVKHRSC